MIHTVTDFLEPDILSAILKKYQDAQGTASFEIGNTGRWGDGLSIGSYSPVLILPLLEYKEYFLKKYQSVDPMFKEYPVLSCFMQIWPSGSHINFHHDGKDRLSSTIYLNEAWHWSWGGLFLFDDQELGQGWIYPHYNKMTWFVPPIYHSVSMITLAADHPRLSIQLFFEK